MPLNIIFCLALIFVTVSGLGDILFKHSILYAFLQMIVSLLLSAAVADVYMQNPRGSNNKLFEQSNTVSNNARLYDSQNNDEGGYQVLKVNKVGDKCIPNCLDPNTNQYLPETPGSGMGIMEFYEGSELQVEWTNQHGSQNPSLDNQIVLQYMCDDGICNHI